MSVLTSECLGNKRPQLDTVLLVVAVLGVAFQIGHFAEHAVQFGMWIWSDRSQPWMSDIAMWLVHHIGNIAMPIPEFCTDTKAFENRQMMFGMELLHLIGNSIFLVTIGSIYYFLPTRLMRIAFAIEAFHLCEHLMLTSSVIIIGKPIGFSTFFGYSGMMWGREGVVGYRVFWHFAMNLIPSVLIMKALMQWFHSRFSTSR